MAVEMTRALADRVAQIARLLQEDDSDAALRRLTGLGIRLVPGADAAAVTVAGDEGAYTFAASDPSLDELHRLQFGSGEGPTVESLQYSEPRHVTDLGDEQRWPGFCRAAAHAGFVSCMMLPLRPDRRHPIGAVALYGRHADAFRGSSYDLALLFAAQGGTAVHNAETYAACQDMVTSLHRALESRAIIEQAKGMLRAEFGVSPDEAFRLLRRRSHSTNRKIRELAAGLVTGEIDCREFRSRRRR
jgi:hypothetical protein